MKHRLFALLLIAAAASACGTTNSTADAGAVAGEDAADASADIPPDAPAVPDVVAVPDAQADLPPQADIVAAQPPTVAITMPEAATFIYGVVEVQAKVQAVEPGASVVEVRYSADGVQFAVASAAPWLVKWDTELETEGSHILRATAKDSLGNQSFDTRTVSVDRTKPGVAFSLPAAGTSVDGDIEPIAVAVDASDNLALAGVEIMAEHAGIQVAVAKLIKAPFAAKLATLGQPSGLWTLRATATDAAGHAAMTQRDVTLNRAPTVQWTSPAAGSKLQGLVTVNVQASDDLGLGAVALFIDQTQVASSESVAGSLTAPLAWSWDTTKAAFGAHTLVAVATDTLGRTVTATSSVTTDQPLVFGVAACDASLKACGALPEPNAEQGGTLHFLASVVDDNAQAASVQMQVDGVQGVVATAAPLSFELDTKKLGDGVHALAFDVTTTVGEHAQVALNILVNNCDLDHDGHAAKGGACGGNDCNDADNTVYLGATDVLGDAKDQNCDGIDGVDADGDDAASISSGGKDCDDANKAIGPTQLDTTVDGTDQNCDGVDGIDKDADGFASAASGGKDCDDANADVHPGAKDIVVAAGCNTLQTKITVVDPKGGPVWFRAAADTNGVVHMAWWSKAENLLRYRQVYGASDAVETIGAKDWAVYAFAPGAAPDGTASVVALDINTGTLHLATRPPSGVWSTQAIGKSTPGATNLFLGVDAKGKRHVVVADAGAAEIRYLTDASGSWSAEVVVSKVGDVPAVAVTDTGSVHIAYLGGSTLLLVSGSAGNWKTVDTGLYDKYSRTLDVDAQGHNHIAWQTSWDQTLHVASDASGAWKDEQAAPGGMLSWSGSLVSRPAPWGDVLLHGSVGYVPGLAAAWKTATGWQDMLIDANGAAGNYVAVAQPGDAVAVVYATFDGGLSAAKLSCPSQGAVGLDENCDGIDGVDQDGDKAASVASGGADCNDADGAIQPGAKDTSGDGTDQNCDGADGVDGDTDGVASIASGGKDCNDADPTIHVGAKDYVGDGIDQDCDGADGADADGDGIASVASGGADCDDTAKSVHPCATDVGGDGVDANCDGKDADSCDDCVACTADSMGKGGICSHVPIPEGGACDDGDACTVGETCLKNQCGGGAQAVCDDGNVCTSDWCASPKGCTAVPSYAYCDVDGSACTADSCSNGVCVNYWTNTCDDGNPCTIDACDPKTGYCQKTTAVPNCCLSAVDCNDADGCTVDVCAKNTCVHDNTCCKVDADCADGETACTTDACVKGTCIHAQTGAGGCCLGDVLITDFETALKDWMFENSAGADKGWQWASKALYAKSGTGVLYYGDPAQGNYNFGQSKGLATSPKILLPKETSELRFWFYADTESEKYDDVTLSVAGNSKPLQMWSRYGSSVKIQAWNAVAVPLKGFEGQEVQLLFNFDTLDGTANTGHGAFIDDLRLAQVPAAGNNVCDDHNPCTVDACLTDGSCKSTAAAGACDLDGSLCTLDVCTDGACSAGPSLKCDDGNSCSDDVCDAVKGTCAYINNTAPCEDGNACSLDDVCAFGVCQPGALKVCPKGEMCVAGACQVPAIPTGMVVIPSTSFTMGCVKGDAACGAGEMPAHDLTMDSYYVDALEVSVADYAKCVGAGVCQAPQGSAAACNWNKKGFEAHPINCIGWYDAATYCGYAGKRLPTEAEWEQAARGAVASTLYPWGDSLACKTAVYDDGAATTGDGCDNTGTSPAGSKAAGANGYGLYDVTGNVWEWVVDYYDAGYYASSPAKNPQGPGWGKSRVVRGGSWQNSAGGPEVLRLSNRVEVGEYTFDAGVGFRCAATPK